MEQKIGSFKIFRIFNLDKTVRNREKMASTRSDGKENNESMDYLENE